MQKLSIIKIGGNVLDDAEEMKKFLHDFANIKNRKILVHGGGKAASEIAEKLGVTQTMINGRRITDAETLKVTTMVYAGLINKQLTAALQAKGMNAFGFSGADGNAIRAKKRVAAEIDYGFVGDIDASSVNTWLLSLLLEDGIVPVFSAITHDGEGQLLNTNADTIASVLAMALSRVYAVELHYCFEQKGVLTDIANKDSVIPTLTKDSYRQLLEQGIISKGMIPKIDNAFEALNSGVKTVRISNRESINQTTIHENAGTSLIA